MESDPLGLGGGINTYEYVAGNPTMLVDPDGRELFLAAVGAIVGGVVNGVNVASNDGSFWYGAGIGFVAGGAAGFINNPFAAGAIAGALTTAGNRYGLDVTNAPSASLDFAIGILGGLIGGPLAGKVGGTIAGGSLPILANAFARHGAEAMGNQIGQSIGGVGANNLVNYTNYFNQGSGSQTLQNAANAGVRVVDLNAIRRGPDVGPLIVTTPQPPKTPEPCGPGGDKCKTPPK